MRIVSSRRKKKTYRPCRRKTKSTVHSRRGRNYIPSRPVVEEIICTVPSRRAKKYIPSRPVVTIFVYRPVPSSQFLPTVPSRRDNFYLPSRPVPSRHYNFRYFPVPSRTVFNFFPPNMSKQYRPVPSRILPAMKSLE